MVMAHELVMMEIIPVLWRWRSKAQEKAIPCHNIACDVNPFMHLMFCLDTIATVA